MEEKSKNQIMIEEHILTKKVVNVRYATEKEKNSLDRYTFYKPFAIEFDDTSTMICTIFGFKDAKKEI